MVELQIKKTSAGYVTCKQLEVLSPLLYGVRTIFACETSTLPLKQKLHEALMSCASKIKEKKRLLRPSHL